MAGYLKRLSHTRGRKLGHFSFRCIGYLLCNMMPKDESTGDYDKDNHSHTSMYSNSFSANYVLPCVHNKELKDSFPVGC